MLAETLPDGCGVHLLPLHMRQVAVSLSISVAQIAQLPSNVSANLGLFFCLLAFLFHIPFMGVDISMIAPTVLVMSEQGVGTHLSDLHTLQRSQSCTCYCLEFPVLAATSPDKCGVHLLSCICRHSYA